MITGRSGMGDQERPPIEARLLGEAGLLNF
jgi:hypothetical protein